MISHGDAALIAAVALLVGFSLATAAWGWYLRSRLRLANERLQRERETYQAAVQRVQDSLPYSYGVQVPVREQQDNGQEQQ